MGHREPLTSWCFSDLFPFGQQPWRVDDLRTYSSSKSDLQTVTDYGVNGVTDRAEIASSFKDHFVKVSKPGNHERIDELNRVFHLELDKTLDSHSNCSCAEYKVTLENVLDATFILNKPKRATVACVWKWQTKCWNVKKC